MACDIGNKEIRPFVQTIAIESCTTPYLINSVLTGAIEPSAGRYQPSRSNRRN